jgi:Kdo2-lipid IVA lauroyltransferase/acyltransferase
LEHDLVGKPATTFPDHALMLRRRFKAVLDATVGALTIGLITLVKWFDRRPSANVVAAITRKIGPLLKEHRLGRDNLRAAFPEKSDAEIEKILAGVWDNLARVAVEFAHLDDFIVQGLGPDGPDTITYAPGTLAHFERIMAGNKAVIGFQAHYGNWELGAVCAKSLGAKTAVLFRRPDIGSVSDLIVKLREPLMGQLIATSLDAPIRLARLLQSGTHIGMLADQHYTKGVPVTFFGRQCLGNPLVAMLARQTEAPIHGLRVVRKPDDRNGFWGEITDAIPPVRDANGLIDVQGTTQAITTVMEGWIREYPEQWLWLHRRWR